MARSDERAAVCAPCYAKTDVCDAGMCARKLAVQGLHVVSDADIRVLKAAQAWYDACEADGTYGSTSKSLAQAVSAARREEKP